MSILWNIVSHGQEPDYVTKQAIKYYMTIMTGDDVASEWVDSIRDWSDLLSIRDIMNLFVKDCCDGDFFIDDIS